MPTPLPPPRTALADLPADAAFDVVVLGAGGAGMSAALFAAIDGRRVLLVERTTHVGGTTAWSGGTTWIAGTPHGARVNPDDTVDTALAYLDHAVGPHAPRELREAFLAAGSRALAAIEANSEVHYRPRPFHPDYLSELPGSTLCGRALEPQPFDGRLLGPWFPLVRPPLPEFTVLNGMMVDRDDIVQLLAFPRTGASIRHISKILRRHVADRMRHPRGTRLVMGNALIGRLLLSLVQRGVTIVTGTEVTGLVRGAAGVEAVDLAQGTLRRRVPVGGGVILASGGFNRHPERRRRLLPGADPAWCPGAPGHTGALHDLAEAIGARYAEGGAQHAFWAPVSIRTRADGSAAVFPHFVFDRGKPGTMIVDGSGHRFGNESLSYHQFALRMREHHADVPAIPSFLVTDADGLRKYGLGMVRPGGKGLRPFLDDGYLVEATSLAGLAQRLGIDGAALAESAAQMNEAAKAGEDAAFRRGSTAYQRAQGDPAWLGPNPTLGPIRQAPFYALRLYPGDIGAATGFATDVDGRVQDGDGRPIAGLYACGNDMRSPMGGAYPGPGITLGPGLAFAFLAARHAGARAAAARAGA